mmetsp:Transcript_138219/g.441660  ORF Transcript_138219/g.441660 Transcript_138219/m.441660 type:complete len:294 (-) Transcript_138219:1246-2127(-)
MLHHHGLTHALQLQGRVRKPDDDRDRSILHVCDSDLDFTGTVCEAQVSEKLLRTQPHPLSGLHRWAFSLGLPTAVHPKHRRVPAHAAQLLRQQLLYVLGPDARGATHGELTDCRDNAQLPLPALDFALDKPRGRFFRRETKHVLHQVLAEISNVHILEFLPRDFPLCPIVRCAPRMQSMHTDSVAVKKERHAAARTLHAYRCQVLHPQCLEEPVVFAQVHVRVRMFECCIQGVDVGEAVTVKPMVDVLWGIHGLCLFGLHWIHKAKLAAGDVEHIPTAQCHGRGHVLVQSLDH